MAPFMACTDMLKNMSAAIACSNYSMLACRPEDGEGSHALHVASRSAFTRMVALSTIWKSTWATLERTSVKGL